VTRGWGNYRLMGDRHLATPNEPNAVAVNYYLREKPKDKVIVTITDPYGQILREISGKSEPGLNTVLWDMKTTLQKKDADEGEGDRLRSPLVEPGEYVVILEAAGNKLSRRVIIKGRRGWTIGPQTVPIK